MKAASYLSLIFLGLTVIVLFLYAVAGWEGVAALAAVAFLLSAGWCVVRGICGLMDLFEN